MPVLNVSFRLHDTSAVCQAIDAIIDLTCLAEAENALRWQAPKSCLEANML